jgi:hypothetical protein
MDNKKKTATNPTQPKLNITEIIPQHCQTRTGQKHAGPFAEVKLWVPLNCEATHQLILSLLNKLNGGAQSE